MLRDKLRRLEACLKHLSALGRGRPVPAPRRLQTAQDVIDLLEEQMEALRAAPGLSTVERARAIGYLAGHARKAIETGTLAARLERMAAVLKLRSEEDKR
jgi:hypothetical protein